MKKFFVQIIGAVLCLLLIICLFQIHDLKSQIADLKNDLNVCISNMETNQNNSISYINQRLDEQASLLATSDWTYEGYDLTSKTVRLCLSVTPKEYYPEVTKAVITVNDADYDMTHKNGEFTLLTDISVFESTEISKVVFIDGDKARTETLDWFVFPKNDYIPLISADLSGGWSGHCSGKKADTFICNINGEININAECYERVFKVETVTLVEEIDGKETKRTDLSDNADYQFHQDDYSGTTYHAYCTVKRELEIPFGSTMELYVELLDDSGFIHRCCIQHLEINSDGELRDTYDPNYVGAEASIYDSMGDLLFTTGSVLYM